MEDIGWQNFLENINRLYLTTILAILSFILLTVLALSELALKCFFEIPNSTVGWLMCDAMKSRISTKIEVKMYALIFFIIESSLFSFLNFTVV